MLSRECSILLLWHQRFCSNWKPRYRFRILDRSEFCTEAGPWGGPRLSALFFFFPSLSSGFHCKGPLLTHLWILQCVLLGSGHWSAHTSSPFATPCAQGCALSMLPTFRCLDPQKRCSPSLKVGGEHLSRESRFLVAETKWEEAQNGSL